MKLLQATTPPHGTEVQNTSTALITDWASRVMGLWEQSRLTCETERGSGGDLGDACRVRDELNNRLALTHPESPACAEKSLDTLRSADALFLQFTVESVTAETLSQHDHYARRGEWWWRRHPRARTARALELVVG